jgi:Skp family chaperone for outer membrane proteins
MQERFTAPQKELNALGESIKAEQEKLKKDELILSKQQKTDAQKHLLEQIKTYREKENELKREVETVRSQALAEFRFTVQKILNELAESKGYDMIFSDGVAFAKKEYDLTEEVLKMLNDQDKKDKK